MSRILITGMSGAGKTTLLRKGATLEFDGRQPVSELADEAERLMASS